MQNPKGKIQKASLLLLLLSLSLPALSAAQGGAPSDPLYTKQWALERVGAPCAWAITTGREDVIVAVVDSGVDMGHPDLQGRLRKDGFDFVDNDGDPGDENGHGTHVTGIIAATLNNAEGGAGLAPSVQVLPVRVMSAEGVGGDRRIAAGISYAVDKGARVINLSLGSTLLLATPESSPLISRAIRRALDAGIVVVVAAGNDFVPLPNAIVGKNDDVLVVAAATRDDHKAVFSNSGPWVDVVAPGERILSTMPTYPVFLTSAALPEDERFSQGYDYMSGTSQAAPFVSALAALVISQHPEWTVAQVTGAITAASADIYPNMPSYYRRLRLLGSGRIDACATLGGANSSSNSLTALLVDQPALALGLGAAGMLLLVGSLAWAHTSWRRRRPIAPRPSLAWVQPPASSPNIGDTLVAAGSAWGRLLVLQGKSVAAEYALSTPSVVIGRSQDATVTITGDSTISRGHARLTFLGGRAQIVDLDSSHGTQVNGRKIAGPTTLRSGDLITLGQTTLRYEG
jgi:subtilisin family serine protease